MRSARLSVVLPITAFGLSLCLAILSGSLSAFPAFRPQDCATMSDKHTQKVTPFGPRKFKVKTLRFGGHEKPLEFDFGSYNAATDTFTDPEGTKHAPDEFFNSFEPFGPGRTKPPHFDPDVDLGVYVLHLRPPFGDILTKGWVNDENGQKIKFEIPQERTTWTRNETWTPLHCAHSGIAKLESKLRAHTHVKVRDVKPSSGNLHPNISGTLINNLVGGGSVDNPSINEKHFKDKVLVISLEASGGVDGKGASGGIKAGTNFEIKEEIEDLILTANSVSNVSGDATSGAENDLTSRLGLDLEVKDGNLAWDCQIVSVTQRLDITSKDGHMIIR
jgi:hypothetical protein